MHDFSKYKTVTVPINKYPHILYVADTETKRQKGLSEVRNLLSNRGMLFVYDEPVDYAFSMQETQIPLQIIFINENFEIIGQFSCLPKQISEVKPHTEYKYVIEVG